VSQQYGHQASYIKHQIQTYKYGEPIIYSVANNSLDHF